jgi:hypothetical protein
LTQESLVKVPIPYNIRLKRRKFLRVISQGVEIKVRLSVVLSPSHFNADCGSIV